MIILKEKLVVLVGPTAVGKTSLSLEIAKRFNGEIISGDSMQIYKGMDIGTAKITKREMGEIPHHLLDIRNPEEPFSTADFQQLVREKISEITSRGHLPIIVGGTGLYIQSVLYDYRFSPSKGDPVFRMEMEQLANEGKGIDLFRELEQVDPKSAEQIHPHNVRRVIRALEVFHTTGVPMSEHQKDQKDEELYEAALIGLTMDRDRLYERINMRVDKMMESGLLDEAKCFFDQGLRDVQSVQAIGYKELFAYFAGDLTYEEAVEWLKKNSRNYAKRQLTWFRNKMELQWFDMTEEREHLNKSMEIIDFIAGKLQIKSNT